MYKDSDVGGISLPDFVDFVEHCNYRLQTGLDYCTAHYHDNHDTFMSIAFAIAMH